MANPKIVEHDHDGSRWRSVYFDDADEDLTITVARRCAAVHCTNTITYEISLDNSRYAPSVAPVNSACAYRGGHLCPACDRRAFDALRGGG